MRQKTHKYALQCIIGIVFSILETLQTLAQYWLFRVSISAVEALKGHYNALQCPNTIFPE
jgi:hypothetical protein